MVTRYTETLGWCDVCIDVEDVKRSFKFYSNLGFNQVEGNLNEGWSVLSYGNFRLGIYQDIFEGFSLNFRGSNVEEVSNFLKKQGSKFKSEFSAGIEGGGSTTVFDQDGYSLFFDTHITEIEKVDSVLKKHGEYAGNKTVAHGEVKLSVKDVKNSYDYYYNLGFDLAAGNPDGDKITLTRGNLILELFREEEQKLTIKFRNVNLEKIKKIIRNEGVNISKIYDSRILMTDLDGYEMEFTVN